MSGRSLARFNGLPTYLDLRDPEARRGTTRLRTIDPNLVVGLDTRRGVYQVYGPSLAFGGYVALCDCQDDQGRPFRRVVPWELIQAALIEARDGDPSPLRAQRHNDAMQAQRDAEQAHQLEEGAGYYARAVAGELGGWGRHSAEDVNLGYRSARDGGARRTAAERGLVVFAPGVVPATGG